MATKAYRFILDDYFNLGRNESWLTDMAQKGFYLKKLGLIFAVFEKDAPRPIRYRMDYMAEPPSAEQLEIYISCGWDYVTHNANFYVFSSETEGAELHTDPTEQAKTLESLDLQMRKTTLFCCLTILLAFALIASIYLFQDEPVLFIVQGQFVNQMLLVLVDIHLFVTLIRNYRSIRRLRRTLAEGTEVNHHTPWKRAHRRKAVQGVLLFAVATFLFLTPIAEMASRKTSPLPEMPSPIPYLPLSMVEDDPGFRRVPGAMEDGIDWNNQVQFQSNLIAPAIYEIEERGEIPNKTWSDGSGTYSPSLRMTVYELRFSGLSGPLLKDLVSRHVYNPSIPVTWAEAPGFDEVRVAQEQNSHEIFVRKDNVVAYVRYYGDVSMENLLSMVLDRLTDYIARQVA